MDYIYVLSEQQVWAIAGACVLMLFDIASGLVAAIVNCEFSSAKMRTGLWHKTVLLLVILLAMCIEILSSHVVGLGFDGVTVYAVCVLIIVMEVGSVMENLCAASPELAKLPIMKIFEQVDIKTETVRTVADEATKRS